MGERYLSTYSIVGRCDRTGETGVAVASAVPGAAGLCAFMRPNVGAVSTQSWVNPYLADDCLDRMAAGASAAFALSATMDLDFQPAVRQLGVVGMAGDGASFTGGECTEWAGHRTGPGFAAQGNMLVGADCIDAMAETFLANAGEALDERLMRCLEAAQAAGGDKRGRQAAGVSVVATEKYRKLDLRVDEHHDPVAELRRVFEVARRQLSPFIDCMPRRNAPTDPPREGVIDMLLSPPPGRPGGGGAREP